MDGSEDTTLSLDTPRLEDGPHHLNDEYLFEGNKSKEIRERGKDKRFDFNTRLTLVL